MKHQPTLESLFLLGEEGPGDTEETLKWPGGRRDGVHPEEADRPLCWGQDAFPHTCWGLRAWECAQESCTYMTGPVFMMLSKDAYRPGENTLHVHIQLPCPGHSHREAIRASFQTFLGVRVFIC